MEISAGRQTGPLTHRLVRRRLLQIPSDQRQLLDKSDSWWESLKNDPHGRCNVPTHVLEGLKALEIEKIDQRKRKRAASSSQPNSPTSPEESSPPNRTQEIESEEGQFETAPTALLPDGASSDSEAISWAPTSQRSSIGNYESQEQPQSSTSSGMDGRSPVNQGHFHRTVDHLPPTSTGSDQELEMEIPEAVNSTIFHPVHKFPQLGPTPPSAQVIPSTCTSSSPTKSAPRRSPPPRRLMKKIDWARQEQLRVQMNWTYQERLPLTSRGNAPDRPVAMESRRNSGPTLMPAMNLQDSSDAAQIVALTPSLEAHKDGADISISATVEPIVRAQAEEVREHDSSGSCSTPEAHVSPATLPEDDVKSEPGSPVEAEPSRNKGMEIVDDVAAVASLPPYEDYFSAYPDYKGGIENFLRAAIVIGGLQERNSLPSFLYDDFIRAFFDDYMPWVAKADAPVPLLMWYNQNVKTLRYCKNVITSENLGTVLDTYVDDIEEIRSQSNLPSPTRLEGSDNIPESAKPSAMRDSGQTPPEMPLRNETSAGDSFTTAPLIQSPRKRVRHESSRLEQPSSGCARAPSTSSPIQTSHMAKPPPVPKGTSVGFDKTSIQAVFDSESSSRRHASANLVRSTPTPIPRTQRPPSVVSTSVPLDSPTSARSGSGGHQTRKKASPKGIDTRFEKFLARRRAKRELSSSRK